MHVGLPPAPSVGPFTGILSGRPGKETIKLMTAGLILEHGRQNEALLLLVLGGMPTLTLRGGWACFEKVRLVLGTCCIRAVTGLANDACVCSCS